MSKQPDQKPDDLSYLGLIPPNSTVAQKFGLPSNNDNTILTKLELLMVKTEVGPEIVAERLSHMYNEVVWDRSGQDYIHTP